MQAAKCRALLAGAILSQIVFTAYCALSRFYNYKSALADIGAFQLFFARVERGLPPLIAVNDPYVPMHWLGFHFSPILYALIPLHFLFQSPVVLILIQSICMGATAWIIFLIARLRQRSEKESLLWAIIFLLNPYLINATISDFHEICIAVPLMAGIAYALLAKRFRMLLVLCTLLVLTKEHYGIAVSAAGIAWMWLHKEYKRGGLLAVAGIAVFVAVICFIMPWFAGTEQHIMLQGAGNQLGRYGWLELSLNEKIQTFAKLIFISEHGAPSGVEYLFLLLGTCLFLPLGGIVLLLPGLADLAVNILSLNPMPRSFFSYHSAPLIPLMLTAAMIGADKINVRKGILFTSLVAVLLLLQIFYSPLVYWQITKKNSLRSESAWQVVEKIIPTDATISLQANLGGHLPTHINLIPFPAKIKESSYVLLRLEYPYEVNGTVILSPPFAPLKTAGYIEQVKHLWNDPEWCIVYWNDPMILFEKKNCPAPSFEIRQAVETDIARLSRLSPELAKTGQ